MSIFNEHIGLYTDDYQLKMAQAHFLMANQEKQVTFNYYFRTLPFKGGYAVLAGVADLAKMVSGLRFSDEDIDYLVHTSNAKYRTNFLRALSDFKFKGDIWSASDGEIIFPHEPVLVFKGTIFEAKMIDTLVMNVLNRTSIHATKTARIVQAANGKPVIDMSLRRVGFGNINATSGALIGGAVSTSNRYAGRLYHIDATGSMAHDWVQAFPSDYEAFKQWGEIYREDSIFLVDTRDTINSGIPAAIRVALEMKEEYGVIPKAVRHDSGDLAYLTKIARQNFDSVGLQGLQNLVSNRLDEYTITSLQQQGACIDAYGVGEAIGMCGGENIDGVFKLAEFDHNPTMKFSENVEKQTIPGSKTTLRYSSEGIMRCDGIQLFDEATTVDTLFDPHYPTKSKSVYQYEARPLLKLLFKEGKFMGHKRMNVQTNLTTLPDEIKRFDNPHKYVVGVSKNILKLTEELVSKK
jgi:nicotinate phosphoribosyltransferase